MSAQQQLQTELESCLADWGSTFSIHVIPMDVDHPNFYFVVNLQWAGTQQPVEHSLLACVVEGDCQIQFPEEDWQWLTKESLFARMWFDLASQQRRVGHE